jgi:hypothetical protein
MRQSDGNDEPQGSTRRSLTYTCCERYEALLAVYEAPMDGVSLVVPSVLAQTTLIERGVVQISEANGHLTIRSSRTSSDGLRPSPRATVSARAFLAHPTRFERLTYAFGALLHPKTAPQSRCRCQANRLNEASYAPVAQLDRALPSEGKGHTFESCRVRHQNLPILRPRQRPACAAARFSTSMMRISLASTSTRWTSARRWSRR